MPGWGTGSFENEDAQKFLQRLNSLTVENLQEILACGAEQEYLEAGESGVVIASAEVVAASAGASVDYLPPQISDWLKQSGQFAPSTAEVARRAVNRVRLNSELKDLWHEAEGLNEWSAGLRDLEARLKP